VKVRCLVDALMLFVGRGGMVLTYWIELILACNAAAPKFLIRFFLDNVNASLNAALLPMLEEQIKNLSLSVADHLETAAYARRLLKLTKDLDRWSTQDQAYNELLARCDRIAIGTPEFLERQRWPQFMVNRANLDAFDGEQNGAQHLPTRKIILPQGAALILHHWQDELDEFVDEIETVRCSSGAWLETGHCRRC